MFKFHWQENSDFADLLITFIVVVGGEKLRNKLCLLRTKSKIFTFSYSIYARIQALKNLKFLH
jgi:hypothetical protein